MEILKKILDRLFSTSAAGLYMVLFAIAIGWATFIENDFGTSSAQKVIFKARWFELLLVLFGITLIVNIFRFRMVKMKKWAALTFHASMVIILIGAGVTRYFGTEGMMHIREGSASNSFLSAESYLVFEAMKNGKTYTFDEPVLFATLGDNTLKKSYLLAGQEVNVEVLGFMPNPAETLVDDDDGVPIVKVVIGGANGREEYYVKKGDRVKIRGTLFNFRDTEEPLGFNFKYENDSLYFKAGATYNVMQMATQKKFVMEPGTYHPVLLRSMYSSGQHRFVFGTFTPHGRVDIISSSEKMSSTSTGGVHMKISTNGEEETFTVFGSKGVAGKPRIVEVGNMGFAVSYGSKIVTLPFSIKLNDFIMEKYPGTNSASSYASEITLADPRKNLVRDQRIYMNHILDYGGYRFFLSSFYQDELGTYLSVNHDAPGTWISYLGYALLTIGLIMVFFSKKSRFYQLQKNIKNMQQAKKVAAALFIGLFFSFSNPINASPPSEQKINAVSTAHAKKFGSLIMQDHRGRFKPMDTYTNEILRKLSKKERLLGMNAEQVVLGMAANPKDWYNVPIIKLGYHEEIRKILGVEGSHAAYADFFAKNGAYKLKEHVRKAYSVPKRDRGVFEKELMKLDEKVNICSMVFSGRFMKVFPVPGDENHTWKSPVDFENAHNADIGSSFAEKFYLAYIPTLQQAISDGDWALANQLIDELKQYQHKISGNVMPSETKVKAELLLNKMNVFSRLGKLYALLGLVYLGLLFTSVFKPSINLKTPAKIAFGIFAFAFLMHTFGLGLRWYISGRAPWSNGYESMIYIGFTTVLAGLIFARKSLGGMAATSVLAATIMMVAGLSYLDPEITPLVPVLKSYWLTIHVSLEAGSYGFLMLGAILGALNLIFMIFANQKNGKNVYRIIKEMTQISEMTLIGGLVMVSIGTYLGGVWANESWGRYWGWDAKETWALVTILVYSFILHMRFIPGFRGVYAFNVATLFGWASVLMTYFGVNYYLSGLHSYAAGDPMPVPSWVYYSVLVLMAISLLAYWRYKVYLKNKKV
ncbi:MAG TPA: cytochrome C biogenesis protein [Bacteroidetes bacterium]|nr:cytochrome C biogenesis protein [Bacteroidota bacterium]